MELQCMKARGALGRSAVGVDATATDAVLRLHLRAVTDRALAVGLAGLLDGKVHGGAGSRLKAADGQAAAARRRLI